MKTFTALCKPLNSAKPGEPSGWLEFEVSAANDVAALEQAKEHPNSVATWQSYGRARPSLKLP